MRQFTINVSDLAVCQRCPALLGYKVHRNEKNAWQVGIKGSGYAYGTMFHENISRVFFEIAAKSKHPLHDALAQALSTGESSALEDFVRENIFLPFIEKHSDEYSAGQILAAAQGVRVWVKAMSDFFSEIPSLKLNTLQTMGTVFHRPEQKLQSHYDFRGEGRLVIKGMYDALVFNPDRNEARLFEFKGYSKSDLSVPLSQSLIYAWLVYKHSGIIPSVEVIYLDEQERKPDIFDSASVREMIKAGLPKLFDAAFNTITLRRLPEIIRDITLCSVCKFRKTCIHDWHCKFTRRIGASLVNTLVFFMAAMMITAQVFFFSNLSQQNTIVQAQTLGHRLQFDYLLDESLRLLSEDASSWPSLPADKRASYTKLTPETITGGVLAELSIDVEIYSFYDHIRKTLINTDSNISVDCYNLNYTAINPYFNGDNWKLQSGRNIYKRIFPPMGEGYYLLRIYDKPENGKKALMYQVLIHKNSNKKPEVKSFMEVWF